MKTKTRLARFLLIAIAAAAAFRPVPVKAQSADRPNFIFIITDDQRWDAMGVVQREQGDKARFPWFTTPNLDRLAGEGVRFRNAFVTYSLCSPSRAAILTGRYNHLNGVANNSTFFPMNNVTYSGLMRDAGYETAYFGKFHHGKQHGPRPGFNINYSFIDQGIYFNCPFEINGTMTPTSGWVDDVTTDFALDFLKQPHDRPFSMYIGFKTPHEPVQPPDRTKDLYADKLGAIVPNLTIPPIFRQSESDLRFKQEAETAIREGRGARITLDYFRCIKALDDDIGRILKALDDLNLAENTVVVFTSDNGSYIGEHCLHDKRSIYDESLRVPMLVRYPKLIPAGKVLDDLVLNIDVAPTFLNLAGIPVPSEMQGRSWRPLLIGEPTDWRKSFLAEYFIEREYPNTPTLFGLRTESHKLVKYPGHDDWTELFDLRNDPYETKNLAFDPASKDLLARMSADLEKQAKEVAYCVPAYADKAEFDPEDPETKEKRKAGKQAPVTKPQH